MATALINEPHWLNRSWLRLSIQASISEVPVFANSEGWMPMPPNENHDLAPPMRFPTANTARRSRTFTA